MPWCSCWSHRTILRVVFFFFFYIMNPGIELRLSLSTKSSITYWAISLTPWTCNSNPTSHICFDRDKFLLTNTISDWCDQFGHISQKTYVNLSCRYVGGIIVYVMQLWIRQEKWKWWYLDASPVSTVGLVIELDLSVSNWPQMWMSVSWKLWGIVTRRYVLQGNSILPNSNFS